MEACLGARRRRGHAEGKPRGPDGIMIEDLGFIDNLMALDAGRACPPGGVERALPHASRHLRRGSMLRPSI